MAINKLKKWFSDEEDETNTMSEEEYYNISEEEALKEAESAAAKKMEAAKKEAGEEAGRLREKASELEKTAVDGVIQKLL